MFSNNVNNSNNPINNSPDISHNNKIKTMKYLNKVKTL